MTEKLSNSGEDTAARAKQIAENIARIRERIAAAAAKTGRNPSEITLVAVTKTMPASDVAAALETGVTVFGENRVQELLEKLPQLDLTGRQAHLIGHLQTNKVRSVIDKVSMIQSLDSLHLAKEIDRQARNAGIVMDTLIEVNIGAEDSKSGVSPQELPGFLDSIESLRSLRVRGLMAIPPFDADSEHTRHYFAQMHQLFLDIGAKKSDNRNMQILSMGMSSDFDVAIEEGSNMVRVGTAIFGRRVKNLEV